MTTPTTEKTMEAETQAEILGLTSRSAAGTTTGTTKAVRTRATKATTATTNAESSSPTPAAVAVVVATALRASDSTMEDNMKTQKLPCRTTRTSRTTTINSELTASFSLTIIKQIHLTT